MPPSPPIAFLGFLQGHVLPAEKLWLSWSPLVFRLSIIQGTELPTRGYFPSAEPPRLPALVSPPHGTGSIYSQHSFFLLPNQFYPPLVPSRPSLNLPKGFPHFISSSSLQRCCSSGSCLLSSHYWAKHLGFCQQKTGPRHVTIQYKYESMAVCSLTDFLAAVAVNRCVRWNSAWLFTAPQMCTCICIQLAGFFSFPTLHLNRP